MRWGVQHSIDEEELVEVVIDSMKVNALDPRIQDIDPNFVHISAPC